MHTEQAVPRRGAQEMIVMAILIGMVLVVGLVYLTYSAGREFLRRTLDQHSDVQWIPDRQIDGGPDLAEHDAQEREAELSRELVSGRLAPAAYQQAMTELAQSGPDRTGDPR